MLNRINLMAPKFKFYKGISLEQYVQNQPLFDNGMRYKDDQTILIDSSDLPVPVEEQVKFIVSSSKSIDVKPVKKQNQSQKQLLKSRLDVDLPSLKIKRAQFSKSNMNTDRNSTDTSQGHQVQMVLPTLLPVYNKKILIRQRNIALESQASSRQISCKKKISSVALQIIEPKTEVMRIKKSTCLDSLPPLKRQKKQRCQGNLRRHLNFKDQRNSYFDKLRLFQQ